METKLKNIKDIHICVNSSESGHSIDRTIPIIERGFKVSFLSNEKFDGIERLEKYDNVRIYILNEIKRNKKYFRFKIYLNLIKKLKPDLIVVHFCGYDRFQAAIYSGIKPIVGVLMGGEVDTHSIKIPFFVWLEIKFSRLMLPFVELLSSKTNRIVEKLKNWDLKGNIIHVPWGVKINSEFIHHSGRSEHEVQNDDLTTTKDNTRIDENRKRKLRKELGLPIDKFLILTNRNVSESGRQLEIVQGFHKLVNKGLNVHLLFVVRTRVDKYWEIIEDYILKNQLEKYITYYDYIPQERMFEYYKVSDVMVSNWVHDGLPQSFFEASLRGLPIIMNNLEQYSDYYKNQESALMNDGSANEIADNLIKLYSNDELKYKISKSGFKAISDKANFDKWAEVFLKEMMELINSGLKVNIPVYTKLAGKLLIGIIWFAKRWPLSMIKVNT